jgi:Tol biopolymer transport system component
MQFKLVTLLLLFSLLLAACSTALTPMLPPSTTPLPPTAAPAPTQTATLAPSITPTHFSPTSSPTATSVPTLSPEARLKIQCLEISSSFPNNLKAQGNIVLNPYIKFDVRLLNLATQKTIQIAGKNENPSGLTVSPDRKYLAFDSGIIDPSSSKIISQTLVIAAADGQRLKTIAWEKDWGGIIDWLNDNNLVISRFVPNSSDQATTISVVYFILNPFTGVRKNLPSSFPKIYDQKPLMDWDLKWGITMFDPSLTAVVYMRWLNGNGGYYGYTIWDLNKNQALITTPPIILYPIPRWSPDGSQFIVFTMAADGSKTELFSVNRNGAIKPLTNLFDYFGGFLYIANYSFSPDGRYIAMWLNIDASTGQESANFQLAILDTLTRQVTDYCVPGWYGTEDGSYAPPPIWSPDGKQLLVEDQNADQTSRVILVDIAKGSAAQIAENMEPIDWMR